MRLQEANGGGTRVVLAPPVLIITQSELEHLSSSATAPRRGSCYHDLRETPVAAPAAVRATRPWGNSEACEAAQAAQAARQPQPRGALAGAAADSAIITYQRAIRCVTAA